MQFIPITDVIAEFNESMQSKKKKTYQLCIQSNCSDVIVCEIFGKLYSLKIGLEAKGGGSPAVHKHGSSSL